MVEAAGPVRIALINAPPYALHEPTYDTPVFVRLSLAALGAYLREHGFRELLLIDAKYERIGYSEIRRRLLEFKPDIVGLTAFTNEIIQCGHVATLVKDLEKVLGKRILTIAGGVHCTALPEQTLQEFPQFDLVAVGEGENTLVELAQWQALEGQFDDLHVIDGLAWRDPKDRDLIVSSKPRANIGDQTTIPVPAWDLLPPAPQYTVMTARGCPYACNFCMNPNGRVVRKRNVDHFLAEVDWLINDFGCIDLHFCDEIFTIDKDRTHLILDGMIERGFGKQYTFHAQTHINTVDEAILYKIASAGCRLLGFGFETGDPETLKAMGKGTNIKRIHEIIDLCRETDVKLGTYFILGQPDEDWRSAYNTVKLAIEANPVTPMFGLMVPYPGTKVWNWAQRGERGYWLKSFNWNAYNKQIGDALTFDGISRRGIEALHLYGYSMVFLRNRRYREFAEFVWHYRTEGRTVLRKIVSGKLGKATHPDPYRMPATEVLALDRELHWIGTTPAPFDPLHP